MKIISSTFADHGAIAPKCTCDGKGVSPALYWSDVPPEAQSLALIVCDPDAPDPAAPKVPGVLWVLYNLPPGCTGLPEAVTELPAGTLEGLNDWNRTGYRGPCPPVGRHRYFHRLYALDVELPDLGQPTQARLEAAMNGHVVAEAALVGTYRRTRVSGRGAPLPSAGDAPPVRRT